MYRIRIIDENDEIHLETENRELARSAKVLCNENKVECVVTRTVPAEEIPVKFRGID